MRLHALQLQEYSQEYSQETKQNGSHPIRGSQSFHVVLNCFLFALLCVYCKTSWTPECIGQSGKEEQLLKKAARTPPVPPTEETNNQPTHRLEYLEGSHTQDFGSGTMLGVSRMLFST